MENEEGCRGHSFYTEREWDGKQCKRRWQPIPQPGAPAQPGLCPGWQRGAGDKPARAPCAAGTTVLAGRRVLGVPHPPSQGSSSVCQAEGIFRAAPGSACRQMLENKQPSCCEKAGVSSPSKQAGAWSWRLLSLWDPQGKIYIVQGDFYTPVKGMTPYLP